MPSPSKAKRDGRRASYPGATPEEALEHCCYKDAYMREAFLEGWREVEAFDEKMKQERISDEEKEMAFDKNSGVQGTVAQDTRQNMINASNLNQPTAETKMQRLNSALERLQYIDEKIDYITDRLNGEQNPTTVPKHEIEFSVMGLLNDGGDYLEEIHGRCMSRLETLEVMLFS